MVLFNHMTKRHHYLMMLVAILLTYILSNIPSARTDACAALVGGDLFKVRGSAAVYLLNQNKERLYFPHSSVYYTWYKDFSRIKEISSACVDAYPIPGKPPFGVNFRPGSYLIKTTVSADVYAVLPNNTIAKVTNEEVARNLYGADWNRKVADVPDVFWSNYVGRATEVSESKAHNGMYVRKAGESTVYYVENNALRPVVGEVVGPVQVVSESVAARSAKDVRPFEPRELAKDPAFTFTTPVAAVRNEPRRTEIPEASIGSSNSSGQSGTGGGSAGGSGAGGGGAGGTPAVQIETPRQEIPLVKLAFTGDLDSNDNTRAVLRLVKSEGAQGLFLQGDLNYQDNPSWLIAEITNALGINFPVFGAIGHHEDLIDLQNKKYAPGLEWPIYKTDFLRRVAAGGGDCLGDYGVNSICHFKGIGFALSGVDSYGTGHAGYIKNNFTADVSKWKICSFHTSEWDKAEALAVMEECRKIGAIVSVSHDHAYGRTYALDSFAARRVIGTATPLRIKKGQTFMMISGLGGQGRGGVENLAESPNAFAYTAALQQNSNFGVLFCEFNKGGVANKASCYFKDIAGKIWDQFEVINDETAAPQGGAPTPTPEPAPAPAPASEPAPAPQGGAPAPPAAGPISGGSMKLGANIAPMVDWSGEWMFTDVFKTARPWISGEKYGCSSNCPAGFPSLILDASGWVKSLDSTRANGGQVARSVIFSAQTLQYLPGEYTVTYEGEGVIEFEGGVKDAAKSKPGMDIVNVAPGKTDNFVLKLVATDPNRNGRYIKNIQVLLPGFASHKGAVQFHPDFLKTLQPYSVIRFMDAMSTNGAAFKEYGDYAQMSDIFWPTMPAEKIAELGNAIGDVWVTMPHQFSDAAVRNFAEDLAGKLSANRKVYVEYSNEVWNSGFKQSGEVARLGCPKYADLKSQCDQDSSPGNSVLCEGHPGKWNPACRTAAERYFSERSVELWNIFDGVFGRSRVVHVMASQVGAGLHRSLLDWKNAYQSTDVLAIAPYVGGEIGRNSTAANWSADRLFTELNTVSMSSALALVDKDAAALKSNPNYANIKLVAYEGGQHLVGIGNNQSNTTMMNLFQSANRDPRMKTLYTQYLNGLQSRGMSLFVHFNSVQKWTKFGSWGAKEYTSQQCSASPKCDALAGFNGF